VRLSAKRRRRVHPDRTGATVVVFMNEAQAVPLGHPADQMFRRVAAILKGS
jgi:hypothetical protein